MKTATNPKMNKSGIFPCGNHILVKTDAIEEVTEGGIFIPPSITDVHQHSVAYGYLIAVGPDAFMHSVEVTERYIDDRWVPSERKTTKYSQPFAEVGDRISFAIYSGRNYFGEDGEEYKVMNDTDITSIVTEGVTATSIEARKPFGD